MNKLKKKQMKINFRNNQMFKSCIVKAMNPLKFKQIMAAVVSDLLRYVLIFGELVVTELLLIMVCTHYTVRMTTWCRVRNVYTADVCVADLLLFGGV